MVMDTINANAEPKPSDRNALIEHCLPIVRNVATSLAQRIPVSADEIESLGLVLVVQGVDAYMHKGYTRKPDGWIYRYIYQNALQYYQCGGWDILSRPNRKDLGYHGSVPTVSLTEPVAGGRYGDLFLEDVLAAPAMTAAGEYTDLYQALERLPQQIQIVIGHKYGLAGYGQVESASDEARRLGLGLGIFDSRRRAGVELLRKAYLAEVSA